MTYCTALLVRANKPILAAVKQAYAAIGAVDGEGLTVHVHDRGKGLWMITEERGQSVDLGVAAALASELSTGVLALGVRGASNYGKAASKAFGAWTPKVPTSGKPAAMYKALPKTPLLEPWELAGGTTLTFSIRKATRTPGPFKDMSATALREAEQGAQQDAAWHLLSALLNGQHAEAQRAIGGLVDTWGYQQALDDVRNSLQTNSLAYAAKTAAIFLQLADRALAGITSSKIGNKWLGDADAWRWVVMFPLVLIAALVAGDQAAWKKWLAAVDEPQRARTGLYVWTHVPALAPAMNKLLERDLPAKRILAWAATAKLDSTGLREAAQLAASEGDSKVLARAFTDARKNASLAALLHWQATRLVTSKQWPAALALFDRLIELPATDLTVFTNALYAVQRDNNGMKLDRARAERYVAAATPHAEANPVIYVNLACVHLELGDREAVAADLAALKRHKLRTQLKELLAQPMFKKARVTA